MELVSGFIYSFLPNKFKAKMSALLYILPNDSIVIFHV